MSQTSPPSPFIRAAAPFRGFQDLMRHRVRDILLVSSLYDAFVLAEDNELNELVLDEAIGLGLLHTPRFTRVSTGAEALDLASKGGYDLIIASTHVADMNAFTLARRARTAGLTLPVVLLAFDATELAHPGERPGSSALDRVFLWQGDVRVLLAIVHDIEDRLNVAHDTGVMGVQALIVIEDNIRFYSSFLPAIYDEVTRHTRSLVPEGINVSHKLMRIQARPKILLCQTFEQAWHYFSAYQEHVLGVVSDIEFPKDGRLCREAGVELARLVRERQPDVPIMLQSSRRENEALARDVGASFLVKGSPTFLQQLRRFMVAKIRSLVQIEGVDRFLEAKPGGQLVPRSNVVAREYVPSPQPAEQHILGRPSTHAPQLLQALDRDAVWDAGQPLQIEIAANDRTRRLDHRSRNVRPGDGSCVTCHRHDASPLEGQAHRR